MANSDMKGIERVIGLMPSSVREEIISVSRSRRDGIYGIREVIVRVSGRCEAVYGSGRVALISAVSREELEGILFSVCGGSVYAYRECIAEGYVPFGDGIRVGVVGVARYERGRMGGVSEVSSMIFRIPRGECLFKREICEIFDTGIGKGMLIYSPPGGGKTTALRVLAAHIGSGNGARRVAVVDERGEFLHSDYEGMSVDILTGYRRREGIEIATRTLAPEVIITDELSGDQVGAVLGAMKCGVPLIATAHASDYIELKEKRAFKRIFDMGVFSLYVGIRRCGYGYSLEVNGEPYAVSGREYASLRAR